MDTHTMVHLILFACGIVMGLISVCNADRTIIKNEDDLIDTCTKTCDEIPVLYNVDKCTKVSGCKFNTEGWVRGTVRCDYCACKCEQDLDDKDTIVEKKPYSAKEYDLYGTCGGECDKWGLVRTDYDGCQEVRDCRKVSNGPLCGLYRNDYCTCTCINRKFASSYELKDIKYNTDEARLEHGPPAGLEQVDLINKDPNSSNTALATVKLTYTQTKTIETSESMQVGLTVTVSAGIDIEVVSFEETISYSITAGFTYTEGSSQSEEHEYSIQASITVPPASKTTATISGTVVKVDIPYTAILVTTYADGSTMKKPMEGIYKDVETAMFTVTYAEPVPINGNKQRSEL